MTFHCTDFHENRNKVMNVFDKSCAEFCLKRKKSAGKRAETLSRPYKRGNYG